MSKEKTTSGKVFDSIHVSRGKKIYYGSVSILIKYLFAVICFFLVLRFINNDITIEGTLEHLSNSNILSSIKSSVDVAKMFEIPLIPSTDVLGIKQLINGLNNIINTFNLGIQAITGILTLLFSSIKFILDIVKYLILGF